MSEDDPSAAQEPPRRPWLDDLLVVAAAALTFARGVLHGLIPSWDDRRFLIDFEPVQRISWDALVRIWSEPHFEAYHPLHLMSYWLDVPFVGPNGPVIHAVSLLLWCGALLLVRRVMRAWGLGRGAALLATLAYGLHPVQVEAVSWATGRKEIVALLFASCSILAHERSTGDWDRPAWMSRLAYVAAALAKTTTLPLPLLLAARDVLLRKQPLRAALIGQLPALVVGAGLGMLVVEIWHTNQMIRPAPEGIGPIALVASTITHHLGTALLPVATSPIYPIHRVLADFHWWDALGPVALGLLLWKGGDRGRFVAVAFVVLVAPVSNLWPLYFEVQDRYLSLPLLPLAFGLGAVADALGRRGRAVLALPVVALALLTVRYEGAWTDDIALWTHATHSYPESFYAWMKLGEVRRDAGDIDGALAAYDKAVEAEPRLRLGHAARFQALARRDEQRRGLAPSRAVELSQRYVRVADDPERLRELAGEMVVAGYREAVLLPLGRALDLAPAPPERLENAALIQLGYGNEWLARFYVSRLGRPPLDPRLRRLVDD